MQRGDEAVEGAAMGLNMSMNDWEWPGVPLLLAGLDCLHGNARVSA